MNDKYSRQQAISSLHPKIRKAVSDILEKLHREGLNFEVFEAWRTPNLQKQYYSQGRDSAGQIVDPSKIITRAKPWQSFHQYGLAVDLVLKNGRRWSWDDTGANKWKWDRMHEIAREHGMVPLSFEKPHIQIASLNDISDLRAGNYPAGGDRKWYAKLIQEISAWDGVPPSPPIPASAIERPANPVTSGVLSTAEKSGTQVLTGAEAYPQIMNLLFELEGGYVDHPQDPGGPTNMGITISTLRRWRGVTVTQQDIKNLGREEASEIYRQLYFDKTNLGPLPATVALCLMNAAVLSGPMRTCEIAQQALNTMGWQLDVDGVIGPETRDAITTSNKSTFLKAYNARYRSYLMGLEHWPVFGKGWENRLNRVNALAKELLKEMPAAPSLPLNVYLVRGLLGRVFSTGMDTLAKKLTAKGVSATVLPWYKASQIEHDIIRKQKQGDAGKTVLIGHSFGANSAVRMAKSLNSKGFDVEYLATLDPTRKFTNSPARITDNFRSNDIRARSFPGANDHRRKDLNHIQIDKDPEVHDHIISTCLHLSTPTKTEETSDRMSKTNPNTELRSEILEIIDLLSGLQNPAQKYHPMTPVNSALGNGVFGRFLNGKKTAIGILGLIAVEALPVLFPGAAPLISALKGLGLEQAAADPEAGTKLLTALFAGFAAWGGIGKLEKWAYQINNQSLETKT